MLKLRQSASVKATFAGACCILIWAFAATVFVFAEDVVPFLYSAVCYFIVFSLIVSTWVAKRHNPLPALRKIPLWFYLVGIVGIGIHNVCWVFAIQNAPPEQASLIIYQWPLFVILFTSVSLKKRLGFFPILGAVFGVLGIFVLMTGKGLDLTNFEWRWGHLYGLLSALGWSIYSAVAARYPERNIDYLAIVFLTISLICFGVWGLLYHFALPSVPVLVLIVVYGLFIGLSHLLWNYGLRKGQAQLLGFLAFLIPALAVVFLILFGLAEYTHHLLASLVLILMGLGLSRYKKRV